jgi:hypothetical protein
MQKEAMLRGAENDGQKEDADKKKATTHSKDCE